MCPEYTKEAEGEGLTTPRLRQLKLSSLRKREFQIHRVLFYHADFSQVKVA